LRLWRVVETWNVAIERTSSAGWAAQLQLRRGSPLRSQRVRGDAAALAQLYERHHQGLYRYCRSILRDDEDARDALQSTMAKALAALRDERRDFEMRPWLFRIAHNESISRLRRRREVADPDAMAAASTDSLAQTVEDRARLAQLRADLGDLTERQRAGLVLRELSGLSHEEIAGVLDSTAPAVKQAIFQARVALQECAEGRAMECAEVQRALSDGDGRVLRGRRLRAHVRSCRPCRQFKAALAQRPADLAALAPPLPAAAGAALLGHLLPGAKAALTSGAATVAGAGGGLSGTVATKAAVVLAATATLAGTTTAVTSVVEPSRPATPALSNARPAQPPRAAPAHVATHGPGAHRARARRHEPVRTPPSARRSARGREGSSPGAARAAGTAKRAAAHRARPPHRAETAGRGSPARPGRSQATHGRSQATHGKSQATHGRSQATHGKSQATHGKSQATHGKSQATHGRSQARHGQSRQATHAKADPARRQPSHPTHPSHPASARSAPSSRPAPSHRPEPPPQSTPPGAAANADGIAGDQSAAGGPHKPAQDTH
jgi:RNA polymerase sigma factor (sigma-70 family)